MLKLDALHHFNPLYAVQADDYTNKHEAMRGFNTNKVPIVVRGNTT
jgi:hypothetical protein